MRLGLSCLLAQRAVTHQKWRASWEVESVRGNRGGASLARTALRRNRPLKAPVGAHTLPFDGNPQPNPLNSDPWLRVNLPTNDSLGQAQYRTRWPTRLSMAKRANPMAPASVSTWAASAPGHSIVMGMTSMVVVFRLVIRCHSRPVGQLTGFGDLVCHASACVRASKCPTWWFSVQSATDRSICTVTWRMPNS